MLITIERKMMNIKIKNTYFAEDTCECGEGVDVKAFSHSLFPQENLKMLETLQIELTEDKEKLFKAMHKTTRRQIRRAEERGLMHVVIENPSDKDLVAFQTFYNDFAKNKQTFTCNAFHMKTMQLLREQHALRLTYVEDSEQGILCYRVYIVDEQMVMNLYSASHFRMANSPEMRKILSQANRYLIWQCILYFQEKGYKLYDMGGLSDDSNIRRFKLGFGGKVVPVYWGYEANSILGVLLLKLRSWKMAVATAREIQ